MTDFCITDHGSVFLIWPLSEAAGQWLDANVVAEAWQWFDGVLAVEHRCSRDIVTEITDAGFEICL